MDAHAHLYPFFDTDAALSFAHENLSRILEAFSISSAAPKVLLLADARISNGMGKNTPGSLDRFVNLTDWHPVGRPDELTVELVRESDGATLFLVQGHQVKARNGLEVLGLITGDPFEDGLSFNSSLAAVVERESITVIPWGFGKWTGARKREVMEAVRNSDDQRMFLGDNSGRPGGWPEPKLFQLGARMGIRVLPGSDPLPLPGEEKKLGRYGFLLPWGFDPERPAPSLRSTLIALETQPPIGGTREGLMGFFLDTAPGLEFRKPGRFRPLEATPPLAATSGRGHRASPRARPSSLLHRSGNSYRSGHPSSCL